MVTGRIKQPLGGESFFLTVAVTRIKSFVFSDLAAGVLWSTVASVWRLFSDLRFILNGAGAAPAPAPASSFSSSSAGSSAGSSVGSSVGSSAGRFSVTSKPLSPMPLDTVAALHFSWKNSFTFREEESQGIVTKNPKRDLSKRIPSPSGLGWRRTKCWKRVR